MKRHLSFLTLAAALLLGACGSRSGHFRLEGRFRNLNQGEFYIYSLDGGINGMDTIKVADGRFSYDTPLEQPATFILVFPNFSEQPVFAEPGSKIDIKGDASHLKEMEISGNQDNELMTKFRLRISDMTPPEVQQAAAEFVEDNPKAVASRYIIQRYFVLTQQPDYDRACKLTELMLKADTADANLVNMHNELKRLRASTPGTTMPDFSTTDINGKAVGRKNLRAKANIVVTWAGWSYESTRMLLTLRSLKATYGNQLAVMGICLDADKKKCKETVERDSAMWPTVCDGQMWQTPLLATLGLSTVPGNIVYDAKGKVVASNLNPERLNEKLKSILK